MSLFGITRRAGLALGLAVTAGLTVTPLLAQEEEEDPQEQQEQQMEEQALVQEDNLLARAEESGRLTLFVRAVKQAGLASELERKGPYTVLAPTDEAFRAHFSQAEIDRLLGGGAAGVEEPGGTEGMEEAEEAGDPEQRRTEDPVMEGEGQQEGPGQRQGAEAGRPDAELVRILRAHILTGEVPASRLRNVRSVQNVLGQDLAVSSGATAEMARARTEYETGEQETEGEQEAETEGEQKQAGERAGMEPAGSETDLRVAEAAVVEADIRAGNGILHLIDGVIVPEPAEETGAERGQDQPRPMEQDTTERDTTEVPPVR